MVDLDSSQMDFCTSPHQNIRLLAPAGCGKTISLLYRCRQLFQQSNQNPRLLIVTFTKSATAELNERLKSDPDLECLIGNTNITTLNAYGDRRIRDRVRSHQLLTSSTDFHFAMLRQLRPTWLEFPHVAEAVQARGSGARRVMEVMDNLKSMGFDHTTDTNRENFISRLNQLEEQGLSWRIEQQFDILTEIGVLDAPASGDDEGPSRNRRAFYDRFFIFWRRATDQLLQQSTFTFEDQKYWAYIELKSPGPDGRPRPSITGAARYDHVLVDEFQDINPLDLALVKVIVERNRATLTIVGDDDQAIFEWRGASPEYILNPTEYFGLTFQDYQLQTNYRSPKQIVTLSQNLIAHNQNRVQKTVNSAPNAHDAQIELITTDGISDRLRLVTDIVRNTEPGKVAVLGRLRRQLIPFQIYYASHGAPFKTAADLDVFGSKAFDDLVKLLDIKDRAKYRQRSTQALNDAMTICDFIKRYPLNRRDSTNLKEHLANSRSVTTVQAVAEIASYTGPNLAGKNHIQLHSSASSFVNASNLSDAIEVISDDFSGLRFDQERAENDVWYTDPPLKQLAEIAASENLDANDLIERIEHAKNDLAAYRSFEDGNETRDSSGVLERPLHLITAHRAKGKEFDTVVILDTDDRTWPNRAQSEREIEAERRLFYVAFTRARSKVIMLQEKGALRSPFVNELLGE